MAIARRVFIQPSTDEVVIHSEQEYSEILAFNKALLNAERPTSKLWNEEEFVLVGRVPMVLVDIWKKQGLDFYDPNDWPTVIRLLNDPDWSGLRTAPGRI